MGEVFIVYTPIQLLIYRSPVTEAFVKLCVCINHICCVRNPCCRKRIYCRGRDWLNCIEGLHSMLHCPFGYTVYAGQQAPLRFEPQSTHRVAIAAFWRTFHHDGKILTGVGGGARPPPFTLFNITFKVAVYAPTGVQIKLPLFHLYPIFTLCFEI